jgi:hypothetical protein
MLSNLSDFSGEGFLDQGTRIRTIVLPGGGAYIVDDEQRERVLGFFHRSASRDGANADCDQSPQASIWPNFGEFYQCLTLGHSAVFQKDQGAVFIPF